MSQSRLSYWLELSNSVFLYTIFKNSVDTDAQSMTLCVLARG